MDMSLDAVKQVTEAETANRERIAAAQAQARRMVADAERAGAVLLQKTRDEAAEQGKTLLRDAEKQGGERAAEIARNAETEAGELRKRAEQRMEAAADWIVGRIVEG